MKYNNKTYIPDGVDIDNAIKRTTHMCIAAHHDDLEIMAYEGIVKAFHNNEHWFYGVVVTDGSGSARTGLYKDYSNEMMKEVRKNEQIKAAIIGEYGALTMLEHTSTQTKDPLDENIVHDFQNLIQAAKPNIIYTHNLADKHDTHIGVATKVIQAIRNLPKHERPEKLIGCEVWRNLDWLDDDQKVVMDVSHYPNLAASLVEVFDSQISGGKRYDLATLGRRLSNATFYNSHHVDTSNALSYGMDLTPLIENDHLDIVDYVTSYIDHFKDDVKNKIQSMTLKK
jgi:LmbE family N-acetylglucosaminyl deacetylase